MCIFWGIIYKLDMIWSYLQMWKCQVATICACWLITGSKQQCKNYWYFLFIITWFCKLTVSPGDPFAPGWPGGPISPYIFLDKENSCVINICTINSCVKFPLIMHICLSRIQNIMTLTLLLLNYAFLLE